MIILVLIRELYLTPRAEFFPPNEIAKNFKTDMAWSVEVAGPNCPDSFILHLVKSAPANFEMRKIVRTYFAEMKKRSEKNLNLLFLFGHTSEKSILADFEIEKQKFDDFVLGNFTDSYSNLPLKTLTGYTYLNTFCSSNLPTWVVFQDDDTFVESEKLSKFLAPKSPKIPHFYCPRRIATANWLDSADPKDLAINKTLWNLPYYPAYCAGPCTIMSAVTAGQIYMTALKTNWRGLPIEDVLFTGIIRKRANLPVPDAQFTLVWPWDFHHSTFCTHYNEKTKLEDLNERTKTYLAKKLKFYSAAEALM